MDNTRKDFHFKVSHILCDAGDTIFMEDLDYRISAKMMFGKHMLNGAFDRNIKNRGIKLISTIGHIGKGNCLCRRATGDWGPSI
ncbi:MULTISPECIES: hypothetical protein [unclassified Microcoleus]|uniref:hypothetical protein n=1 Tax=unclassified Microcoleus TaxID=2642155 RepID=UPI002FCF8D43